MQLCIGKNHQADTAPVQSIFRLVGSDEDALTYALGFLLAYAPTFCAKIVRRFGVAPRKTFKRGYSIHLQEVTDPGFGRRDIVIEARGMRIVIEAKIGGSEPTAGQLLKYAGECKLWNQYEIRAVVALTQTELPTVTREKVRSKLSEQRICFYDVQWHQILDLVLGYRTSDDSEASRYLFDQFIRYIRRDYRMGYYDAEILIQDVNPLNAGIFKDSWLYVTNLRDKKAPLYFAPYFTRQGANSGISMISRVRDAKTLKLADTEHILEAPTDEHLRRWSEGLASLRKRAEKEGFLHHEVRLFFLDRPITVRTTPLSKKSFKETGPSKLIPRQIPKGFSLGFDDLLMPRSGIGES